MGATLTVERNAELEQKLGCTERWHQKREDDCMNTQDVQRACSVLQHFIEAAASPLSEVPWRCVASCVHPIPDAGETLQGSSS